MLRNIILTFILASPRVSAQHDPKQESGCLKDQSEQVAADIKCGQRSPVTFAVEQYGANAADLQEWLQVAGCSEEEAVAEAIWAAQRCQVRSTFVGTSNLELRGSQKKGRHLAAKPDSVDKRDDGDNLLDTTDLATYPNKYAMTMISKSGSETVTSIRTCMTEYTTTTKVCSLKAEAGKTTRVCDPHATIIRPTCADGYLDCRFTSDTGKISCYEKDGIPTTGFIVMGIMGVVALFLVATLCNGCLADHRRARQRKEAESLASLAQTKHAMPATTSVDVGDTRPLMAATQSGPHGPFTDEGRSH